jgi:hypothetical protein
MGGKAMRLTISEVLAYVTVWMGVWVFFHLHWMKFPSNIISTYIDVFAIWCLFVFIYVRIRLWVRRKA